MLQRVKKMVMAVGHELNTNKLWFKVGVMIVILFWFIAFTVTITLGNIPQKQETEITAIELMIDAQNQALREHSAECLKLTDIGRIATEFELAKKMKFAHLEAAQIYDERIRQLAKKLPDKN